MFSCIVRPVMDVRALLSFRKLYHHTSISYLTHHFDSTHFVRHYCTPQENGDMTRNEEGKKQGGGFAKAYEKFSAPETDTEEEPTFARLLKNSKFIDLGDPEGKVVTGTIFHVVEDDLYVDFGWKFHCVVTRPAKNGHEYVRGAKVRLAIRDLELSSRFLGSEKDLTLLEADAILLGLLYSPARANISKSQ